MNRFHYLAISLTAFSLLVFRMNARTSCVSSPTISNMPLHDIFAPVDVDAAEVEIYENGWESLEHNSDRKTGKR